jgi:hypothetical protein
MGNNSLCFVDNYPEAANSVTITENNVSFDGADANWYNEVFVLAAMTDDTTFTLANYPVSDGSIALFKNSGAQIQGTDYSVHGNIIVMADDIVGADTVLVRYFAYATATSLGIVAIGGTIWQAAATPPTGFCLADGSTEYAIADYTALYTYATANSLVLSETATNFIMKDLGMTVGGVVLYAVIKN